jgi:tetratricopeptide (TPR) repeat protein
MEKSVTFLTVFLKWLAIFSIILWIVYRRLKNSDDERLLLKLIVTALLLPLIMASIIAGAFGAILAPVFGIVLAFMWGPNVGAMLASPITSALDGGNEPIEPQPFYSIAEARRKQGRYQEAAEEVRKQLEQFPSDFQGWLLLAQIQAEDFKDLPAAETSIGRILNEAGQAPTNIAHALTRLADWQLKLGHGPEMARQSFERIIERFPETELARNAAQRIAHLANPDRPIEGDAPRTIHLVRQEENIGLRDDFTDLKPPEADYADEAAQLIKQIGEHPLDAEARERLAVIYAENYGRLDLAVDQLEQLLGQPQLPPKQTARWLNLMADFYLKHADNPLAARQSLERIIELHPKAAVAELAKQRISFLGLESKGQKKSQVLKLGSYEDNIGLKGNWPTA